MINKKIHLYVKEIKPKATVVDRYSRNLIRVLEKVKTQKYKSYWIKKNKNGALVNRKIKITNTFASKDPVFIKTQLHSERYNYFLRQFLSPGIYEHVDLNLKDLFSVSTNKKLDNYSNYDKFNHKKLDLAYEVFIVLGKKVVGVVRIIFVQSLKDVRPVRCFYNNSDDITENSILICDDNKVIGYTKHVIKSIHVLLRSIHSLNEVTQLQILSSIRVATNDHHSRSFSSNNFNTYVKLNFKARAKRIARFKNRIKNCYIDKFKLNYDRFCSLYYSKPSKTGDYFFNKFYKIKDHTEFVSNRIFRFVLHLYWKYLISESNIFMLQAYLRERAFSNQLKKLKISDFRNTNKHIKSISTLAQLQPTLEKLIPNRDAFIKWIWKNKSSLVSDVLQQFQWVKLCINLFTYFKNEAPYKHFKKIKNMLLLYQRNHHSSQAYFVNTWTRELIGLMKSRLTLGDIKAIIKIQNSTNYDVPDFYASWDFAEQDVALELRDLNVLCRYLDDRFVVLYFENIVNSLSINAGNAISSCQNLWILWSIRYINILKKTPSLNPYDVCFLYEKVTGGKSLVGDDIVKPYMLNSSLKKPYLKFTKNNKPSFKLNFNVSPQFTPQTNVSLFLKKLFKSEDFDLQQVLSPSFLQTPYIGVDFSEGFDPKFHSNPNRCIANYFKKGYIKKHYIKTPNYIYKPHSLTNFRAASLCLSILHEKVNIDETYLDDLFSFKTSVKIKKKSVREFRRLTSFRSKKALKKQLLFVSQAIVDSSVISTVPEKLDLTMTYALSNSRSDIQHGVVASEYMYNVSLNKLINLKDIGLTRNDVWNKIICFDKSRWDELKLLSREFNYPEWHNRIWALDNIWNFTTKMSKKLWLNLLGFDELLEAGLGQHQLKECIDLMFMESSREKNDTPMVTINRNFEYNLANRIEQSDLSKWWSIVYSFTTRSTQKYIRFSKSKWRGRFRSSRYSRFNNFDDIFSRFLYVNQKRGVFKKKKDMFRSRSDVITLKQDPNPVRFIRMQEHFSAKRLQSRGIKMFMGIYTMCALYNSLARSFLPLFVGTELRKNSKFIIENQPNLVIRPKPISFKLLFNFKKHYLYITLLDQKNNIIFSLHTGLFLKFFEYKKSLKKSKSLKILLIRYLRKLFLLSGVRYFTLYVKQTSDQLNKILRVLQKPINHPFTDPLTGLVINEELDRSVKRSQFFHFIYIVFFKNKPYGSMRTKKTGRLKRKIRRLVIKANRIID